METPIVVEETRPGHGRVRSAAAALARNAAHLVLGQAATTVFAVLLGATLGRSLGAADFGLLFLITSMSQFAFVVVEWGQLQFVVREVARDTAQAGELLGNALALRIAGTALVILPILATAWAFGYDGRTRALAALLLAAMLPFVLAQAFALIFRGCERMDYESMVSVLNKAGTLGLTLAALALGLGLPGAILAQGVAGLGALALAVVLLRRLGLPPLRVSRAGAGRIVSGGAPLVAMSVAVAAQSYVEAVVLSKLASNESIGWFGAAKVILGTLMAPATILGSSAYPRIARAAHDPALLREELQVALRPLLGLAVLGAVGTYLFAPGAVALIYGAESFAPAGTILQVFAPGLLLLFLDILLGNAVLAVGRPLPLAVGKIAAITASTLLSLALVPFCQDRYGNGGIGVALAFFASELIMFAIILALVPRHTFRAATFADLGRAVAAGGATLLVFRLLPDLPVLLGAPLCAAVFATLAAAVGLIRQTELAALRSRLRGPVVPTDAGRGR